MQGHYDSVIHDYRETLLSSVPPSPSPSLTSLLARLYSLLPGLSLDDANSLPPPGTSTHLLHLSPKGAILPHVDNLEASGSVILGLSLGAERTMRLKKKDGAGGWEVKLPSASVYLQR
jgi:alkylated DNA repair protein alkB family protein 7